MAIFLISDIYVLFLRCKFTRYSKISPSAFQFFSFGTFYSFFFSLFCFNS